MIRLGYDPHNTSYFLNNVYCGLKLKIEKGYLYNGFSFKCLHEMLRYTIYALLIKDK